MNEDLLQGYNEAKARSQVYFFLSMVYLREPTLKFLRNIKDDKILTLLRELGVEFGEDFLKGDDENLLDDLATEYSSLFIQPGGFPPVESVRLTGLYMQEPAGLVKDFYQKAGFALPEEDDIFPDHLGIELEFMGCLLEKEVLSLKRRELVECKKWKDLESEFLEKHLGVWVTGFTEEIEKASFHSFYREMAKLTRKFMDIELDVVLGERKKEIAFVKGHTRVLRTKGVRHAMIIDMNEQLNDPVINGD